MITRFLSLFCALCISLPAASHAADDPMPPVSLRPVFGNDVTFERPVYVCSFPDGQQALAVVEQQGIVHRIPLGGSQADSRVILDIAGQVSRKGNEEGLLGLAFSPEFKRTGELFVMYSVDRDKRNRVSRFTYDPDRGTAPPETEKVILEIEQPYRNHNGGMVGFGPDGYLYIGLGDGGSGGDPKGNGQNLGTLLATILRIDVTDVPFGAPYGVPMDNPFSLRPEARDEIWAYGLRNPWRFSFDHKTGDLWVGDVGQNKWEEIDIVTKGGNFGWNLREGFHAYDDSADRDNLIDPVVEHGRDEAISITGGYVYRGKRIPDLVGAYVYGDFGTGLIWALRYDHPAKEVTSHHLIGKAGHISSFGEDAQGELYLTDFEDGTVYGFYPTK